MVTFVKSLSSTKLKIYLTSLFIFSLPFIHLRHGWNPFEHPKFIFFIVWSYILGIFSFVLLTQKSGSLFTRLSTFIVLFGIFVFFCNMIGLDPKTSFLGTEWRYQGFLTLSSGVLLYLSNASDKREDSHRLYYFSIVLANIGITLFSFWQIIQFFILGQITVPLFQGRIVGTMGNPNFLGGFLAMTLPFVLMTKNVFLNRKIVRISAVFLNLIVIMFTQSRGAIISFAVVMILFLLHRVKFRRPGAIIYLIIVILLTLIATISVIKRDSIWDSRGMIWKEGVTAFSKRPITGYGQENFELIFPKERLIKVDSAHNIFIEILVSSGIIGLLLYMCIIFEGIRRVPLVVKIAIIAFLVRAQFNPLSIAEIGYFWFMLSL